MRLRLLSALVTGCGLLALAAAAPAQDFPNKPIRIFTAEVGGSSDLITRIIAQGLSGSLGQQAIVENRPTNAAESVARAAPDGYTLLHYGSTIWIAPFIRKVSWDVVGDFAPVTMTVIAANILVVNPALPVKSVKDLLALAKARPGELNYASSGIGSATHLSGVLFKALSGVNIVHINYKGVGPALNDVLGGRVELMFVSASSVVSHMKTGRLRGLAITNAEPSPLFPDLPTISASGVPGYESVLQVAMFAPIKTPAALVSRINQEVVRVLHRPDIKDKFYATGLEPVGDSVENFAATLKADIAKWGKVIKDAGIRED